MRAGRSMLCSLFVRDFLLLRPPSPHSPKRSEKDVDQKRNRKTPSWCGSRKRKAARTPYDARITEYAHQGHLVPPRSILKTPEQIVGIRESGKINIAVLDHVAAHIKAGMTTDTAELTTMRSNVCSAWVHERASSEKKTAWWISVSTTR